MQWPKCVFLVELSANGKALLMFSIKCLKYRRNYDFFDELQNVAL